MTPTQSTVTSLPEVLYEALKAQPRTRRDLERAAAVKGYAAVQVEVALSKARKLGLFVQEPMYRLTEDAMLPEPPPVFAGMDVGEKGGDRTVIAVVEAKPRRYSRLGRKRSPFWQSVNERVKVLGVGDSCRIAISDEYLRFSNQVSDRISKWVSGGLLPGTRYSRRTERDHVVVTRLE